MPTPKRVRKRKVGRPRKHAPGTGRHERRLRFAAGVPVHVTMRLVPEIRNARKFKTYHAIRWATVVASIAGRVKIVHFSIQKTHLHAIVEAKDARALARGMQGFQISAARQMNGSLGRKGQVFADRYHATYLDGPVKTRNAIRYVLCNWRHHELDRDGPFAKYRVDPFSSAPSFDGFTDYNTGLVMEPRPRTYEALCVAYPRTWMLRVGWRERGGGPFSARDMPAWT